MTASKNNMNKEKKRNDTSKQLRKRERECIGQKINHVAKTFSF
jgi:hypothetical protein